MAFLNEHAKGMNGYDELVAQNTRNGINDLPGADETDFMEDANGFIRTKI